ncbi:MAG: TonB family protein [Flavobacteriales bacterium]|nr:TonB family protein [Flavobacteriales bacterium]
MDKGERLIKKPVYPGGRKAMDTFIKSHLKYPAKALEKKISGTVAVVIDIDGSGHVLRGRVKKSLGHGCDEEAVRVCKLLKFKTAEKRKNRRITFHRTINIHFRPPSKKKIPKKAESSHTSGMQVVYTYVPTKKES